MSNGQTELSATNSDNQDSSTNNRIVSPARARAAMVVLVFVYILNFLDRQIINILAEPIKQEFGLSDWQLGLLTGFVFALFYAIAGIPIARIAERVNRRNIIGISVAVWSVFTIFCGMASSYIQLLLLRMGVGVGEAGLVSPANSLITDITPRKKLASALAIFYLGLPLGTLLGLAFGGIVADLAGWRVAFILAGAPGIIAVALVFFVLPEPRSKLSPAAKLQKQKQHNFSEALKCLRAKPSFVFCAIAAAAISATSYAHQAFGPAFFFRVHSVELASVASEFGMQSATFLGISFGLLLGIFGSLGMWASGRLADRLGQQDVSYYCLVPALALICFIPVQVAAFLVSDVKLSIVLFGLAIFFNSFWFAPVQATVQSVSPKHMRATASSIVLLGINLIGLGLGPLLLGIISDLLLNNFSLNAVAAIRGAMIIMTSISLISILSLFLAAKHVKKDYER